jgi:hypothetical protein
MIAQEVCCVVDLRFTFPPFCALPVIPDWRSVVVSRACVSAGDKPLRLATITYYTPRPTFTGTATATRTPTACARRPRRAVFSVRTVPENGARGVAVRRSCRFDRPVDRASISVAGGATGGAWADAHNANTLVQTSDELRPRRRSR